MVLWIPQCGYLISSRVTLALCLQVNMWSSAYLWLMFAGTIKNWLRLVSTSSTSASLAGLALDTLGPKKERTERERERGSPNNIAEGTTTSGIIVSLYALTAKLNKNPLFYLGWSIWVFRNVHLIVSLCHSHTPSAQWCCAPDLCYLTVLISRISTKVHLNFNNIQITYVLGSWV